MDEKEIIVEPLIKWAGGKRQLLPELIKRMPKKYDRYYEPFLGAGALFFEINPKEAVISDFNVSLINLYKVLRDNPDDLMNMLSKFEKEYNVSTNKEELYYKKRNEYNKHKNSGSIKEAALFVFLNKTDYNGLYRVNGNGLFNVPFGHRTRIDLMNERVLKISERLQKTEIREGDFEKAVVGIKKNDFVYFDPPYYKTFVNYQTSGFNKDDQIRLYNLFSKLDKKGIKCMVSNSDDEFIIDLYKNYKIDIIKVRRLINRNGNEREANEVIITNY